MNGNDLVNEPGWTSRSNPKREHAPSVGYEKQAMSMGPLISGLDDDVDMETGEIRTPAPGVGTIARLPMCDTSNPGDLEAWFGPFGYADHFRKIVVSSCKEIERAKNPTASEAKLDTLAHVNDNYVDFLIQCLNGRRLREQNVLDSIRRG